MRSLKVRSLFTVFFSICSLVVALPVSAVAQPAPGGTGGGDPSKVPDVVDQVADRVERAEAAGQDDLSDLSNALIQVTDAGRVEITLHSASAITEAQRDDLLALGATNLIVPRLPGALGDAGLVQARVPAEAVDAAAALPWVATVTTPGYGVADTHPTNPLNSEGVVLMNADDVQGRGINGAGVNVGVISDGVTSLATAQAQNELPAVTVLNTGAGDEGTAMLEIVHDMAPGAGLIFDTQGGVAGHAAALNNLVANGANVITEDLAFDGEPAFQQGLLATTAENIANGGVTVHSSAGNQAQRHAARVTATGTGGDPTATISPPLPPGAPTTPTMSWLSRRGVTRPLTLRWG